MINLNKPLGLSSARALDQVRRLTGQRRSGHTGTLDPAADGVLVLCLGRATKMVEQVMDQPKVYLASARLDVTSESFDVGRPLVPVVCDETPLEALRAALRALEGEIQQAPPAVSAIKVGGRRAYRLAAEGAAPVLAPRAVRVYWIVLHEYAWPTLKIEVACGRGVYIRAIIRDVGLALGTGGCLTGLTRTRVGPFDLQSAWTPHQIEHARSPEEFLVSCERAGELLSASRASIPPRPADG